MSTITQRFKGESIEDALASVSAELGPQAQIVDVRRARTGGLFGFFAKEHFEVEVEAAEAAAEHAVDLTLAAMADRLDAAEQAQAQAHLRFAPMAPVPLPEPLPPAARDADHWMERLTAALSTVPGDGGTVLDPDLAGASVTTRDPMALEAPATSAHPGLGWSRAALRARGMPQEVLGRLPAEDPVDDMEWTNAMARAIAAVLPPADPHTARLSVACWEVDGVFDLLAAAAIGIPPSTIRIDGRDLPATPMELALAVRTCLRR